MDGPAQEGLRLYGAPSGHPGLAWDWVDERLREAGTYWVLARGDGWPHPRPVWGAWLASVLHLSVGSPVVRRCLAADPRVTVHLDSGTQVVVVEGLVSGTTAAADVVAAYDAKYDWSYDVATYGELLTVRPRRVLAWRTAGPAGRDSFQQTGRWTFPA